jgi:hypothetical protein
MRSGLVNIAAAFFVCIALASCVTSGLYQPADVRTGRTGYAETQLGEASWRVEFVGDDFTSRETVETYLLYRAAELTLESGYAWFAMAATSTNEEVDIIVEAERPDLYRARYWRPSWRQRSQFFWSDVDPVGPPIPRSPPQGSSSIHYSAAADIVMGRGEAPVGAFMAADTIARLEGSIVRPQT